MNRREGSGVLVCGFCGIAPRHRDREGAHLRCTSDHCECSLHNHRPPPAVRAYQANYCGLTVERCAELDPGIIVNRKSKAA